jgi:aconitate hydratase
MGVFPLTFQDGQTARSLSLDGTEVYDFEGLTAGSREATVQATSRSGEVARFKVNVRVDTPKEWEYMDNGGILHFVLRQLAA